MLAEPQEEGLFSSEQIREYIGESFRERIRYLIPEWYSNQEICDYLMRKQVLVHLKDNEDKFNLICFMIKKLFLVRCHAVSQTLGILVIMLTYFTFSSLSKKNVL